MRKYEKKAKRCMIRGKALIEEEFGWNKVLFIFQWGQTANGQITKYKLSNALSGRQISSHLSVSRSIEN